MSFGNRPAASLWLRFVPLNLPAKEVQTDSNGRFALRVGSATRMTIEFRTLRTLPLGSIDLAGPKDGSVLSIELPDTVVRLSLHGALGKTPAQLQFYQIYDGGRLAQHPQLAGIVTAENFSATLNGFRPGRYRIVADAPGGFVSKAPADVDIKVGTPSSVSLELATADRIVATEAGDARFPQVRVFAGQKTLEGSRAQLVRVSPGMPVVVTSPGFLPKCVVVAAAAVTAVKLDPAEKSVAKLIIGPEKAWPAGALAGPKDACFIDARQYTAKSTPASSSSAIDITGLPSTGYSFMPYEGAPLVELLPSRNPVNVNMPLGCNDCRSTYPAKTVIR